MKNLPIKIVLSLFLIISGIVHATTVTFNPSTNNPNNPHRGFMLWGSHVGIDNTLPDNFYDTNIYHVYLPWRLIEPTDNNFRWDLIETNYLAPITNLNPKATFVLRLVADYPNGPGSAINAHYGSGHAQPDRDYPDFIDGVYYSSCEGNGPGYAAYWNTTAFSQQAQELINSYAAKFDGDPRVTAIQLGLLGMWGEWHQSGCDGLAPNDTIKTTVMNTYLTAFTQTPLQIRYVFNNSGGQALGFYEDYFPSFTADCTLYQVPYCSDAGSWSLEYGFVNISPTARNNWQQAPISGESPLQAQKDSWINNSDVVQIVKDYHFSFLGPAGKHEESGFQNELLAIQNALGYRFEAISATLSDNNSNGQASIALTIKQAGSAPSYVTTNLNIDWLDSGGQVVATQTFSEDLQTLLPDAEIELSQTAAHGLADGNYQLRAYLSMPNVSEKIILANQNLDSDNRLIIGSITVSNLSIIFKNGFEQSSQ